ncbi:MAG: SMC-Scp complex subunit ScpB [Terracidiphilus sp.]|jgi:segregation and condensation protein B
MSLKAKLEAVIYAAEEPVTLAQLAALFTADALEWKAEQAAASAAEEPSSLADSGEPSSLQTAEFAYPETEEVIASLAARQSPSEPNSESDPGAAPETTPETVTVELGPGPDAEAELELRRQARQRDREVRTVIRQLLDELIASYSSDSRGVEIREIAGGFRMATKPECHDSVRAFVKSLKQPLKLSLPALETLAVVAYKQPVTAPEVNEIRGVDSSGVFGSLLARKLITTAGRKPVIGRPILYKTTREFLLRFGLKDVTELPSMEEFEKMAAIELDEPELPAGDEAAPAQTPQSSLALTQASDESLEIDESDDQPGEEFIGDSPDFPDPYETAAMAARNESSPPKEAAPAAPPSPEQAETENLPHGQEEKAQ